MRAFENGQFFRDDPCAFQEMPYVKIQDLKPVTAANLFLDATKVSRAEHRYFFPLLFKYL